MLKWQRKPSASLSKMAIRINVLAFGATPPSHSV
jgi:hypothetical protein